MTFFQTTRTLAAGPAPQDASIRHPGPAALRRWRAAVAKMRADTGYRPRVVFIGDSKTVGAGAGATPLTGSNVFTDGAEAQSKTAHFTRLLTEIGIPASRQSFFASSGLPNQATKMAYDPRVAGLGSGWSGGSRTLGGVMWATSGANPFSFAPEGPCSRLELISKRRVGDGTLGVTADADAVVLATVNGAPNGAATADGFARTVVDVARGTHVFNFVRQSGGYVSVVGAIAQDISIPAVDVINGGAYGTVSSYHAGTQAWDSANALEILAPDLVFVELGTNDLRTGQDIAATRANILQIAAKAKATGADVVLEIPSFGPVSGSDTQERRTLLKDAIVSVGTAQGLIVVDHDLRLGAYAEAAALGLHRDSVPHETSAGHLLRALTLREAVRI